MVNDYDQGREQFHERFKTQMKELFNIEDTSGLELIIALHRAARLSEVVECQASPDPELSGPRWRLMLRLLVEEKMGNPDGITPTILSHSQRVSKNTISALLRGLEEQGLIKRTLDPKDLRVFRIQLTPAGRASVMVTAPQRIADLNRLVSVFDQQEREQLMNLLSRLQKFLMAQSCAPAKDEAEN
jgi:DNA-binding MarR family transcriptional regulator